MSRKKKGVNSDMSAVVPIARPHALAAPPQRAHNKIRLAAQMAAPFFANTAQAARCCSRARHLRPTHLATPMRSTRCVNLQCGQATQLRTAQAAVRTRFENSASGCENPIRGTECVDPFYPLRTHIWTRRVVPCGIRRRSERSNTLHAGYRMSKRRRPVIDLRARAYCPF